MAETLFVTKCLKYTNKNIADINIAYKYDVDDNLSVFNKGKGLFLFSAWEHSEHGNKQTQM